MSDFDSDTDSVMSQMPIDDVDDFKLTRQQQKKRFPPAVEQKDIDALVEQGKPKNTTKQTNWAYNVFTEWRRCRNSRMNADGSSTSDDTSRLVPELTKTLPVKAIDYWLARFVLECRRQDGSDYPATTLKNLCCGIQRQFKDVLKRPGIKLFDLPDFADFRNALDARMKQVSSAGVGAEKKQAQPVSVEMETILWDKGCFSLDTANGLHQALYFYNSKVFGGITPISPCNNYLILTSAAKRYQTHSNMAGLYSKVQRLLDPLQD